MSDEFIKIATQEILEDISKIDEILDSCQNDSDISSNVDDIQRYFHKIKGLAPMMGKTNLGDLAAIFDSLMKQMQNDKKIDGIYDSLSNSIPDMIKGVNEPNDFLENIKNNILSNFS